MDAQQFYFIIIIVPLAIILGLLIFMKKAKPGANPSPLVGLSFAFVIGAIVFGENRLIGYSLIGIGVLLALIDIVRKIRK